MDKKQQRLVAVETLVAEILRMGSNATATFAIETLRVSGYRIVRNRATADAQTDHAADYVAAANAIHNASKEE